MSIGAPSTDPASSSHQRQRAETVLGAPIVRTVLLRNAAVSTSGDTEQFVEIGARRYSHIVDPRTGMGLTERLQVSIIAKHATDTDSFATAVSVLGVERGLVLVNSRPGMAALILRKNGEVTEASESRRFKRIHGVESLHLKKQSKPRMDPARQSRNQNRTATPRVKTRRKGVRFWLRLCRENSCLTECHRAGRALV